MLNITKQIGKGKTILIDSPSNDAVTESIQTFLGSAGPDDFLTFQNIQSGNTFSIRRQPIGYQLHISSRGKDWGGTREKITSENLEKIWKLIKTGQSFKIFPQGTIVTDATIVTIIVTVVVIDLLAYLLITTKWLTLW